MFSQITASAGRRSMAGNRIVAAARLQRAQERAAQATHKTPVKPMKETKQ